LKKLLLFLTLLSNCIGLSQNLTQYGHFYNKYFSQKDFQSATQIWTGVQDESGLVLFGNNNEILSFNGKTWKILPYDTNAFEKKQNISIVNTKVTKLIKSSKGKVFVGRYNNFGEISYTKKGEMIYKPLYIAKKDEKIGEIWNIFEIGNKIYFVGEFALFEKDNNKISKIDIPNTMGFSCKTAGAFDSGILLAYRKDNQNDIERKNIYLNLKTKKTQEIKLSEDFNVLNIRATFKENDYWNVFLFNGNVIRLKEKNGSLVLIKNNTNQFEELKGIDLYGVYKKNQNYFVATDGNGILVFNEKTKLIRQFNAIDGMENLTVYSLFLDNENNIWACLIDGIHYFETSSPITSFDKRDGLSGVNYGFNISNGKIQVASQNDIWEKTEKLKQTNFKPLNIIQEEIFDLKNYETDFGNKTLAVAFTGIYDVNLKTKSQIKIIEELAWLTYQNPLNRNEFFVGNEGSLGKLILANNKWTYTKLIDNIDGEILNISHLNDKIYFGVRNIGIYEFDIKTNKSRILKFSQKRELNTSFVVSNYKGNLYFGLQSGLFVYDKKSDRIVPFKELNNKFIGGKDYQIHRIFNENNDKLWVFIWNGKKAEHGYLEHSNGKWSWTSWPFEPMNLFTVPLASNFLKISNDEYWFSNGSDILIYNDLAKNSLKKNYKISIESIFFNNNQILFNPDKAEKIEDIDYKNNSIRFEFRANTFMGFEKIKYRYNLENYIDNWSDWSELNFADFKKLDEGTYNLKIQAKNIYGFESQITTYTFTILPPWYRTWWAYTLYFLAFIICIYFVIKLSIQRIKNQNIKLEGIVEERTSEIAEQNKKLENQKEEIEKKTQDIVDSIIYAKRIQETILPDERLDKMFEDFGVFYRPKDIVSGDFYWARQKGDLSIFSAIDCTGHGVPGALVSIVGNASLLRCVNEHKLTEPSEILDKHREIVVKSFVTKTQKDVKDGMDMSLCVLDKSTLKLKYAGANNECIIIRNKEIIELKPDKQPIGQFAHAFPFTQKEIQLQKGDNIYLYTDGYVDQFGGEKGKKLKSRPFKEFLIGISDLTMKEQLVKIEIFFDEWMRDYDQVDDVCVFGVKI
jgi:serine phosphatase RsbU (regulator of sigma subunit)